MSYIELGDKDKPVLVLIHGLGSKKESWINQFELKDSYRLIIPDLRGHGESEFESCMSINSMARDIIELLDELEIDKASFCGISLGGIVTQHILAVRPDIVESVVLANTATIIPFALSKIVTEIGEEQFENMPYDEFVNRSIKLCIYDNDNEKLVNDMREHFFDIRKDTYVEASKVAVGKSYWSVLMFSCKPTLIIGALQDEVTPYINTSIMKFFSPPATLVTLDKCGHASNMEKPKEFNNAVRNFLKTLDKNKI